MFSSSLVAPPLPPPLETGAIGLAEITQLRLEFDGSVREVVALFKEEGRELLEGIRAAASSADGEALRRGAHALKGCCDNFGARPLAALCRAVENWARGGAVTEAVGLLPNLCTEFERVEAALDLERQKELL